MRLSQIFGAPLPWERAAILAEFEPHFAEGFEGIEKHFETQSAKIDMRSSLLLASAAILIAVALVFWDLPGNEHSGGLLWFALRAQMTLSLLVVLLLTMNLFPMWQLGAKKGDREALDARLRQQVDVFCNRMIRYALAWWLFSIGLVILVIAVLARMWCT